MQDDGGKIPFLLVTAVIGAVGGAIIGGIVAAKSGGEARDVIKAAAVGAAVGGLIGLGVGAGAGVLLTGSATASTAVVASGGANLSSAVAAGGASGGTAYVANNLNTFAGNAYSSWQNAEQAVRNLNGGTKATFNTPYGNRVVDSFNKVGQIAREVKYGYQGVVSSLEN